jgi:hypothetical protein
VLSIKIQDASAAAAPAPSAQSRTVPEPPVPGLPTVLLGSDGPLGFESAISVGESGLESGVSIGSAPSGERRQAERMEGDENSAAPVKAAPQIVDECVQLSMITEDHEDRSGTAIYVGHDLADEQSWILSPAEGDVNGLLASGEPTRLVEMLAHLFKVGDRDADCWSHTVHASLIIGGRGSFSRGN